MMSAKRKPLFEFTQGCGLNNTAWLLFAAVCITLLDTVAAAASTAQTEGGGLLQQIEVAHVIVAAIRALILNGVLWTVAHYYGKEDNQDKPTESTARSPAIVQKNYQKVRSSRKAPLSKPSPSGVAIPSTKLQCESPSKADVSPTGNFSDEASETSTQIPGDATPPSSVSSPGECGTPQQVHELSVSDISKWLDSQDRSPLPGTPPGVFEAAKAENLPEHSEAVVIKAEMSPFSSLGLKPAQSMQVTSGCLPTPFEVAGQRVYWIDTLEGLGEGCRHLKSVHALGGGPFAVDCEGVRLSKEGKLCILQVATPMGSVFIFDICALGDKAFSHCLKDLLESKDIIKVFQDARQDVDALYWQYEVRVAGVWDTQVADVLRRRLLRQRHEWATGLPKLIQQHSADHPVCARLLAIKLAVNEKVNEVPELWTQRPLAPELLEYAVLDVAALLPLKVGVWKSIESVTRNRLTVAEVDSKILALSGLYAVSFVEQPHVCSGPEFARFPSKIFDSVTWEANWGV